MEHKVLEEEVFKKELNYVYNIAYQLTLNKADSEDLAQETLVKAWEKEADLKSVQARYAWLKKICVNLFYMKIRKEKGKEGPFNHETFKDDYRDYMMEVKDESPSPEKEVMAKDEVRILRDHCFLGMTQKLTLNQRVVYMSVDLFGLSLKDAGEIIGCSEAAAKAHLYRARNSIHLFFSQKCRWINIESTCRCEAYADALDDIEKKKRHMRPPKTYYRLQNSDDSLEVDEASKKKIIDMYVNIPSYYPEEQWFDKMIDLHKVS